MLRSTDAWVYGLPFFGAVRAHIESTAQGCRARPQTMLSFLLQLLLTCLCFGMIVEYRVILSKPDSRCKHIAEKLSENTDFQQSEMIHILSTEYDIWPIHVLFLCINILMMLMLKSARNPWDQLVIFFAGIWKRQRYYPLVNQQFAIEHGHL